MNARHPPGLVEGTLLILRKDLLIEWQTRARLNALTHGLRAETLVRDADAAMYSAKSLGRNQTYVFAEPEDDAGVLRAPISPIGRARAEEIGRAARETVLSSLTAVIGILELTRRGQIVFAQPPFQPIPVFALIALIYFTANFGLGQVGRRLEARTL